MSSRRGLTFVSVHDCYWTHALTVDIMNQVRSCSGKPAQDRTICVPCHQENVTNCYSLAEFNLRVGGQPVGLNAKSKPLPLLGCVELERCSGKVLIKLGKIREGSVGCGGGEVAAIQCTAGGGCSLWVANPKPRGAEQERLNEFA